MTDQIFYVVGFVGFGIAGMILDYRDRLIGSRHTVCWSAMLCIFMSISGLSWRAIGREYGKPSMVAAEPLERAFTNSVVGVQLNNLGAEHESLQDARNLVLETTKYTGRSGQDDEYAMRNKDGSLEWRKTDARLHQ